MTLEKKDLEAIGHLLEAKLGVFREDFTQQFVKNFEVLFQRQAELAAQLGKLEGRIEAIEKKCGIFDQWH